MKCGPLLLLAVPASLLLGGCGPKESHPDTIVLWGQEYSVKPANAARPLDFSGVEFIGACPEADRRAIAFCLGRIAVSNLPVKRIWLAWSERPTAARVQVGNQYIYLVRCDGEWHIADTRVIVKATPS